MGLSCVLAVICLSVCLSVSGLVDRGWPPLLPRGGAGMATREEERRLGAGELCKGQRLAPCPTVSWLVTVTRCDYHTRAPTTAGVMGSWRAIHRRRFKARATNSRSAVTPKAFIYDPPPHWLDRGCSLVPPSPPYPLLCRLTGGKEAGALAAPRPPSRLHRRPRPSHPATTQMAG